jgi:uncharacterized protein (DUF302 family)
MNAESIESVTVAYPGTTANYFQCDRLLTQSISEIVPRLKVSIESAGFWILHEIDAQGLLKRGGYEIRAARQILFFHPRFMARLLRADAAALIEAPLKFGLLELPTGDVSVRWINPAIAFARYGNNALRDLGEELAAACDSIVEGGLGASAQAR